VTSFVILLLTPIFGSLSQCFFKLPFVVEIKNHDQRHSLFAKDIDKDNIYEAAARGRNTIVPQSYSKTGTTSKETSTRTTPNGTQITTVHTDDDNCRRK